MKKTLRVLALASTLLGGLTSFAGQPVSAPAWDQAAFALRLFRQAAGTNQENFIVSPYSASSALGLASCGAKGDTAREMQQMLCMAPSSSNSVLDILVDARKALQGSTNGTILLETTDSFWPELSFQIEKDFTRNVARRLGAFIRPIPMNEEGQRKINGFVARATHGRIPTTFAAPPDPGTKLIILNTVYFNGKWRYPFEREATREEIFHAPAGDRAIPFLHQTEDLPYYKDEGFSILRLPYGDGGFEMDILLPDQSVSLPAFEASLTTTRLRDAIQNADSLENVSVELPKFEFASTIPLNAPLQALGMRKAFTGAADFSGISRKGGLFVSDVFQKANVTVDEEGTVAAAVTAISMCRAMPMAVKPILFRADRPFLFLIRHGESGQVLFFGRVASPVPPDEKK